MLQDREVQGLIPTEATRRQPSLHGAVTRELRILDKGRLGLKEHMPLRNLRRQRSGMRIHPHAGPGCNAAISISAQTAPHRS